MAICRQWAAVFLVLLLMGPAAAAMVKPKEVILRAYLSLDSEGAVQSVEWPRMEPQSRPITDRLEKAIRRWEFEPGTVDGSPVATRTGLTLWVGVGNNSQGGLTLSITKAQTGVVADHMVLPRYPMGQAKSGNSATVTLVLDVDGGGSVSNVTLQHYESRAKSVKSREEFEAASRAAAMLWKFTPESVAGKPIPSQVRVPFDFCMDTGWCYRKHLRNQAAGQPETPSGMATALDSVVRIKSEITATEI